MKRIEIWKLLFENKDIFLSVSEIHNKYILVYRCEVGERWIRRFINECNKKNILEENEKTVSKRRIPVKTYKIKNEITWKEIF